MNIGQLRGKKNAQNFSNLPRLVTFGSVGGFKCRQKIQQNTLSVGQSISSTAATVLTSRPTFHHFQMRTSHHSKLMTMSKLISLYLFNINIECRVIIYNQYGQIAVRVFKKKVESRVNNDAVKSIKTLFDSTKPVLNGESFHHGPWQPYFNLATLSEELVDAIAFYDDIGYTPLWKNQAIQKICQRVDSRFSAMAHRTFKQYCEVVAPRFYTCSFTMCVINVGGTSAHYDKQDEPEGYCCMVPLGKFTGGDLVFREHKIRLALQPGDMVFFHSRNILHENLPFTGERHSLVFTTHHNVFTEFGQTVNRSDCYNEFKQKKLSAHKALEGLTDDQLESRRAKRQPKAKKIYKRKQNKKDKVKNVSRKQKTYSGRTRHQKAPKRSSAF